MTRAVYTIRFLLPAVAAGFMASHALAEASLNTWVVKGFDALKRNQADKALRHFEKAQRDNPYSHEIECYAGLGHFKTGDYTEALEHFTRAEQGDPTLVDSAFLFYSASCYRALGLVSLEREAWERVKEWDPDSSFAETARRALSEPTRDTPSIEALLSTGRELLYADKTHAAVAHFTEGYKTTADATIFHAVALNETGQYDEMLKLQNSMDATHKDMGLWQIQRAFAFMMTDALDSAMDELDAIENTGDMALRRDKLRILCNIQSGRQEESAAGMQRLVSNTGVEDLEVFRRLVEQIATINLSD